MFLSWLELDHPRLNQILREDWPYYDRNTMGPKLRARFKWVVWSTLNDYENPHKARTQLLDDEEVQRRLGFAATGGVPGYDMLNTFWKWCTTPTNAHALVDAFLAILNRQLEALGHEQVEDALPYRSRRKDPQAPINGHDKTRMHKPEARWCTRHDAFLVGALSYGTHHEAAWSAPFTRRLKRVGLTTKRLTVDRAYPSYGTLSGHHVANVTMAYHPAEHWAIDAEEVRKEVAKRYNKHWEHTAHRTEAAIEQQARFLIEHGPDADREAAGKGIREAYLEDRGPAETARVGRARSLNESYNTDLHRVLLHPDRRGIDRMVRLCLAGMLTLHAVQLCRAQHGVSEGLCRLGSIL